MEKRLKTASTPWNIQHTFIASLRATKANNKLPIVMKTKCNPWRYIVYMVYILYMYIWVSMEPAKRKAIRHAILESTRTAVIFLQLKQTSFSTYSRLWSCLLSHLSAERLRLGKEKVGKCKLNKCGNRSFWSDCRDRFKLCMYLIFVAFPFFNKINKNFLLWYVYIYFIFNCHFHYFFSLLFSLLFSLFISLFFHYYFPYFFHYFSLFFFIKIFIIIFIIIFIKIFIIIIFVFNKTIIFITINFFNIINQFFFLPAKWKFVPHKSIETSENLSLINYSHSYSHSNTAVEYSNWHSYAIRKCKTNA